MTFVLFQFSRKDHGVYKAVLSDDRGKDSSVIDISGQGVAASLSGIITIIIINKTFVLLLVSGKDQF